MLIRHSVKYIVAKVATGLVAMATTMILTRLLAPAEYGLYGLALVVMTFGSNAGFDWLQVSFLRLYEEQRENPNLLTTIFYLFVACMLLSATVLALVWWLPLMEVDEKPIYAVGFVLIWSYAWFELVAQIEVANFRPGRYLSKNVARAFGILVGAGSAAWLTRDPVWTGAGTALGILAGSLTGRRGAARHRPGVFDSGLARQIAGFGLPMAASLTTGALASSGTRAMTKWLGSAEALGYYTAASALVQNTLVVLAGGISAAGYQLAVRAMASGDSARARQQLLETASLLLAVLMPAALGAALTAKGIAVTMVGPKYADMLASLTPWFAAAAFFASIRAYYLDYSFQLGLRPYLQLRVMVVATVVSITLAFWLIPLRGPQGAAIAMTVAMAASCIHARLEGAAAFPLPLPTVDAIKIALACVPMAIAVLLLRGDTPIGFALQVAVGALLYLIAAAALNLLDLRTRVVRLLAS